MPAANLPLEPENLPETPHESALSATRERRASERLITDWEGETRRLGHALAVMTLDVSAMTGPKWACRFVLTAGPIVEDWCFLFYGARFASLMELPETADRSVPMVAQLPERYVPVFTNGGIASTLSPLAVRIHGAIDREGGRRELYRAAFITFRAEPNGHQPLAFGAFNCRVVEGQA
jgi:hypothetical protein